MLINGLLPVKTPIANGHINIYSGKYLTETKDQHTLFLVAWWCVSKVVITPWSKWYSCAWENVVYLLITLTLIMN